MIVKADKLFVAYINIFFNPVIFPENGLYGFGTHSRDHCYLHDQAVSNRDYRNLIPVL